MFLSQFIFKTAPNNEIGLENTQSTSQDKDDESRVIQIISQIIFLFLFYIVLTIVKYY
jgi:hypothetical protein